MFVRWIEVWMGGDKPWVRGKANETHHVLSTVNQLKALLRQQATKESEVSPSRRRNASPLVRTHICNLTRALSSYFFFF